jgi:hypothetical protein
MLKLLIYLSTSFFVLLSCSVSLASPFPGTASSALVSPESGLFYTLRGFHLKAQANWILENSDSKETADASHEFSVFYIHPDFKNARLSVQTDTLKSDTTLETYTKKWMKDYSNYGFDVLGAKTFQTVNAKGLVVDLHHKKKETQLRQVIFLKDKTAVILTCLDQTKTFAKSLVGCNQLVRSFQWTRQ